MDRHDLIQAIREFNVEKLNAVLSEINDKEFDLSLQQYMMHLPVQLCQPAHMEIIYATIKKYLADPIDDHIHTCLSMLKSLEKRGWKPEEAMQTFGIAGHVTNKSLGDIQVEDVPGYTEENYLVCVEKLLGELFISYGVDSSTSFSLKQIQTQINYAEETGNSQLKEMLNSISQHAHKCEEAYNHAFQLAVGSEPVSLKIKSYLIARETFPSDELEVTCPGFKDLNAKLKHMKV